MRAGLLRDRITFEERAVSIVNNQNIISWASAFDASADIQRISELACRFIVRYRSGVTPADSRILWEGRRWTITGVIHDRRKTMLTIECDGTDLVETTTLESTEREYIDGLEQPRPAE